MKHRVKTAEDLAWLMEHTRKFQSGQVLELHVEKRRIFDEMSGKDVSSGTVVTALIRYDRTLRGMEGPYAVTRVAKLTMRGVTDFSIFGQEGTDFSEIEEAHAEVADGQLRFWFDPCGELYMVCDEAELEEVSRPVTARSLHGRVTEWTFQADAGDPPPVQWFLDRLDQAGHPCAWREIKPQDRIHPSRRWEGQLIPTAMSEMHASSGVYALVYGPLGNEGFGIMLRIADPHKHTTGRLLIALADMIARHFSGLCLAGNHIFERDEWLEGQRRGRNAWPDA